MASKKKKTDTEEYGASQVQVLVGLEGIRRRPAMYIGSTDSLGLHQLVIELIDNGVDEAIAGFCDRIKITLHNDGSLEIYDNGRGIPVDQHPQTKISTLETVMTILHAGGKFDKGAYKVSGGLHGIGLKCTNALSEWMTTTIYRDGFEYSQEYSRGKKKTELKKVGKSTKKGTRHVFKPDNKIFKDIGFDFDQILQMARGHAYLTAGLRFTLIDERKPDSAQAAKTSDETQAKDSDSKKEKSV